MSRISADQLPTPFTAGLPDRSSMNWVPAAPPPTAPSPATFGGAPQQPPQGRRPPKRSLAVLVIGGVAVLALGGLSASAIGGDDRDPATTTHDRRDDTDETDQTTDEADDTTDADPTDIETNVEAADVTDPTTAAAGDALTRDEVASAYALVFGVTGSPDTIDCVASGIGTGTDAVRLVRGEALDFTHAESGFEPFVACAPDGDFLVLTVAAAAQVFGGQVDQACASQVLVSLGVADRAALHALALVDPDQFASQLYSLLNQCAI